MFIDINNPIVIDNTDITDPNFPASFYMPFNMDGHMDPDELREEARWWTDNLISCQVYQKLERSRSCTPSQSESEEQEPLQSCQDEISHEVDWSFIYDPDGNPKVFPEYPETPDNSRFIGWRVHMNYLHGWTDSESDYEGVEDSSCGLEMPT